jgi:hexosaminidase
MIIESKGNVLGFQANLWTETVLTVQRLDFMLFPRMAALAAAAWTKKTVRQIDHFENTLKSELYLYNKAGIDYYNPFDPAYTPEVKK